MAEIVVPKHPKSYVYPTPVSLRIAVAVRGARSVFLRITRIVRPFHRCRRVSRATRPSLTRLLCIVLPLLAALRRGAVLCQDECFEAASPFRKPRRVFHMGGAAHGA